MNQLTSPLNVPALPDSWAEKIFQIMENRYMSQWMDKFGGLPRERVKRAWAEDLYGYTGEEIARGLETCKGMKYPPNLSEFQLACRPALDPKTEWAEACEQMRIRLQGNGGDVWSRPQVYWAAVSIGWYDLNQTPWEQIKARWTNALENASTQDIPEYKAALPKPGQATTTREDASKRLQEIAEKTGVSAIDTCEPNTRWAVRLAEREAAGEDMSLIQKRLWRDALGVTMNISAKDALAGLEKAA